MGQFVVESSQVTHEGLFSRIRVDRVRMPDGDSADREVAEHVDAVAVLPLDADGQVVLLRQYRHPVGEPLLEIPAGILDVDGEDLEAAARRELLEEVGLEAAELHELVRFHNSAGWTDESTMVYLARDLRRGRLDGFTPEAEEADMEMVRMPLPEAVALAEGGKISDAKTLIALLLARARALG